MAIRGIMNLKGMIENVIYHVQMQMKELKKRLCQDTAESEVMDNWEKSKVVSQTLPSCAVGPGPSWDTFLLCA